MLSPDTIMKVIHLDRPYYSAQEVARLLDIDVATLRKIGVKLDNIDNRRRGYIRHEDVIALLVKIGVRPFSEESKKKVVLPRKVERKLTRLEAGLG